MPAAVAFDLLREFVNCLQRPAIQWIAPPKTVERERRGQLATDLTFCPSCVDPGTFHQPVVALALAFQPAPDTVNGIESYPKFAGNFDVRSPIEEHRRDLVPPRQHYSLILAQETAQETPQLIGGATRCKQPLQFRKQLPPLIVSQL